MIDKDYYFSGLFKPGYKYNWNSRIAASKMLVTMMDTMFDQNVSYMDTVTLSNIDRAIDIRLAEEIRNGHYMGAYKFFTLDLMTSIVTQIKDSMPEPENYYSSTMFHPAFCGAADSAAQSYWHELDKAIFDEELRTNSLIAETICRTIDLGDYITRVKDLASKAISDFTLATIGDVEIADKQRWNCVPVMTHVTQIAEGVILAVINMNYSVSTHTPYIETPEGLKRPFTVETRVFVFNPLYMRADSRNPFVTETRSLINRILKFVPAKSKSDMNVDMQLTVHLGDLLENVHDTTKEGYNFDAVFNAMDAETVGKLAAGADQGDVYYTMDPDDFLDDIATFKELLAYFENLDISEDRYFDTFYSYNDDDEEDEDET